MRNAKPAHVYVMQSDSGLVKVGRSAQPETRRNVLAWGTGNVVKLSHVTELRADASFVETAAHHILAAKRRSGEWFNVTVDEAIAAVVEAIRVVEIKKDAARCKTCVPAPWKPKRPPSPDAMGVISVRFTEDTMRAIECIAASRLDQPGKADIIRELVALALAARGKRK